MGKRKKSSRSQIKKLAKPKLETTFPCPYCSEDHAVECKVDRNKQTGLATCRSCQAGYQTIVNYLTDPVDIVAEWVDAIEQQRQRKEERKQRLAAQQQSADKVSKEESNGFSTSDQSEEDEGVEEKEEKEQRKDKQEGDQVTHKKIDVHGLEKPTEDLHVNRHTTNDSSDDSKQQWQEEIASE